ncbi:TetR/AcrR family transcriptional regulator [Polymorphum gilvum]|uniref:Transcriptional regulator, TetR family n=1 Tax=Polymorphum gilvum (strain LMG 25793 / CGMCC 1.9160 / SL003B-26A1) TaxID=991905 RepID=F2J2K7_POLGS|nr:TetR/AcrR family transcriptional regulator [Polymorphum gilvum]ADZ70921.1 Transcriptional regulator, TetR family [Polymorphum gilvum SL003B-26A1]
MTTRDTSPGDRRRLSPEERRALIIAGATAYFSEVGLDGNTRELSKRLGVTQSLIFNYFATKTDLLEAVYRSVYLDRISPDWPGVIADRARPIRERALTFYREYTGAIFSYEWMRIFMFSGLAGAELNRRYLQHVSTLLLKPLLQEFRHEARAARKPEMEDLWNLHGGIVYIGIRRYVYQMPCPDDSGPAIAAAIDRFLDAFEIGARPAVACAQAEALPAAGAALPAG